MYDKGQRKAGEFMCGSNGGRNSGRKTGCGDMAGDMMGGVGVIPMTPAAALLLITAHRESPVRRARQQQAYNRPPVTICQ